MSIFKREQEPPYNRARCQSSRTYRCTRSAEPARTAPAPPRPASPGASWVTRRRNRGSDTAAPPVARDAAAVIDRKTEITGTLHSSGNVLIEGPLSRRG